MLKYNKRLGIVFAYDNNNIMSLYNIILRHNKLMNNILRRPSGRVWCRGGKGQPTTNIIVQVWFSQVLIMHQAIHTRRIQINFENVVYVYSGSVLRNSSHSSYKFEADLSRPIKNRTGCSILELYIYIALGIA